MAFGLLFSECGFDGEGMVKLANNTCKCVKDIKVNDEIISRSVDDTICNGCSRSNASAIVRLVIPFKVPFNKKVLSCINGAYFTPSHPVKDVDGVWKKASEVALSKIVRVNTLYHFEVDEGYNQVVINDTPALVLGVDFTGYSAEFRKSFAENWWDVNNDLRNACLSYTYHQLIIGPRAKAQKVFGLLEQQWQGERSTGTYVQPSKCPSFKKIVALGKIAGPDGWVILECVMDRVRKNQYEYNSAAASIMGVDFSFAAKVGIDSDRYKRDVLRKAYKQKLASTVS